MRTSRMILIFVSFPLFCVSQTLTGKVINKANQQPIETVAVYFDNTTIGTTTNQNGEFSINYTDAVQSTLVISYLGFEKVFISDYRSLNNITIELIEATSALDEVFLEYDDGLTRRQKLRLFRKEFLGASKFGKSCKILNEDDLVLRYSKKDRVLYASSEVAINVKNKALQYEVAFDIVEFEVKFRYANLKTQTFTVNSVTYFGTSFYKNLDGFNKRKTVKNRESAYKGSVQHFMRSLYNKNIREEGYWIYHDSFRVEEWSFFSVEDVLDSDLKKVTLSDKITVLYDKELQSELELTIDAFYVDTYGNHTPIIGLYFSGDFGNQRVGDTLPLDYGI